MNRSQMMAVLAAAEESKLIDAMAAIGVPMDRQDGGVHVPLESWNARDVSVSAPQGKPPALADTRRLFSATPNAKGQSVKSYMEGCDDDETGLENYMPQSRPDVYG